MPLRLLAITALIWGASPAHADPANRTAESMKAARAGVAASSKGKAADAVKHLQRAVQLDATNHFAWYHLGHVRAKQRRWTDAERAFEKAIAANDVAMYQMWLGISRYENRNKPQAIQALLRAVGANEKLYRAHAYLGRAYRDVGEPRKAALSWTRACKLAPKKTRACLSLAVQYTKWGYHRRAQKVLLVAAQHARDANYGSDVHYRLGVTYVRQRKWKRAIAAFTRALGFVADNNEARLERGLVYARLGKKARARADLERYIKKGFGHGKIRAVRALRKLRR